MFQFLRRLIGASSPRLDALDSERGARARRVDAPSSAPARPEAAPEPTTRADARDIEPTGDVVVRVPIEDAIDLHTFRPNETASAVDSYLYEAHARGFREVRIIHGRGKGVQRRIVRSVLEKHPLVSHFADAPPARGGWGATLAWFKGTEGDSHDGAP